MCIEVRDGSAGGREEILQPVHHLALGENGHQVVQGVLGQKGLNTSSHATRVLQAYYLRTVLRAGKQYLSAVLVKNPACNHPTSEQPEHINTCNHPTTEQPENIISSVHML
jgi:hypothetical protein